MFVLARAVTYSTLFIGLFLIFLPNRILSSTGIPDRLVRNPPPTAAR